MVITCEVPGCPNLSDEVMVVLGPGPGIQAVSMCTDHAINFTTPVEPAPRRNESSEP